MLVMDRINLLCSRLYKLRYTSSTYNSNFFFLNLQELLRTWKVFPSKSGKKNVVVKNTVKGNYKKNWAG